MTGESEKRQTLLGFDLYNALGTLPGDSAPALELIRQGASLSVMNNEGVTTLMCAAAAGADDVIRAMAQSGANILLNAVDDHGWTALITAAHRGHAAAVRELLAAGADVTVKDKMGRSAGDYAAGSGDRATQAIIAFAENGELFTRRATVAEAQVAVSRPLRLKK